MTAPAEQPGGLTPGDHARLLIGLLRPVGPELARRWLAALLVVEEDRREALVRAMERRVMADAGRRRPGQERSPEDREIDVVWPPQKKDGYFEQKITTYGVTRARRKQSRPRRAG